MGTSIMLGYRACAGVSAEWSYITVSPSLHALAIPLLSPVCFMHVGHPYILLYKISDLLVQILLHAVCLA